jgi:hypothetical protein
MKNVLFALVLSSALGSLPAHASNVDFNVDVNIGAPPRIAVPAPVPAPPPAPPAYGVQPVMIEAPPEFIAPPQLGFYAAVGVPYDLFFVGSNYYLCRGNVWYVGQSYNGPWIIVRHTSLPHALRMHSVEKIRYYRDAGYRDYRRGHNSYWEKHHFHPEKVWKEQRKAERKEIKEYRKAEHDQWKREKWEDRHQDRNHGGRD